MSTTIATLPGSQYTDADAVSEAICVTATEHGASSDADHEVGDLQDSLRASVALLAPESRVALLRTLAETTFAGEGGEDVSFCRTEGCLDDPDDGEGFDGYCGNCADAKANGLTPTADGSTVHVGVRLTPDGTVLDVFAGRSLDGMWAQAVAAMRGELEASADAESVAAMDACSLPAAQVACGESLLNQRVTLFVASLPD